MTIRELIKQLELIENKDLPVFIFNPEESNIYDLNIDDTVSDRVDLNMVMTDHCCDDDCRSYGCRDR